MINVGLISFLIERKCLLMFIDNTNSRIGYNNIKINFIYEGFDWGSSSQGWDFWANLSGEYNGQSDRYAVSKK